MVEHPGDVYAAGDPVTPAQADLSARLASLPGWSYEHSMDVRVLRDGRWLAGVIVDASGVGGVSVCIEDRTVWINLDTNAAGIRPVLSDATAGVLLGMLWRADPAAGWHVHGPPGLICVHNADRSREFYGDTLGEAVAGALIAVGRCA